MGTIHSFVEDLEFSGLTHEIIVVDNLSDDLTFEILSDKFRRWVRAGKMKLIRLDSHASTWEAINVGAAAATGEALLVADAHISVRPRTCLLLIAGALGNGGLWHAPVQKWGDTEEIKTWGYDLRLAERFWGDPCPYRPEDTDDDRPWPIPMAGACLYAVRRDQAEEFGLYDAPFRAYGGGEPYLCMKFWMLGSGVYLDPRGLCRHAFGIRSEWKSPKSDVTLKSKVMLRGGEFTHNVSKGQEYLSYDAGYKVDNADYYYNFLLASGLVGGREWLDYMGGVFKKKFRDPSVVDGLVEKAWADAADRHSELTSRAKWSLNSLLRAPPWRTCPRHPITLPEFVRNG